jgi:hypothetical protein
VVVHADLDPAEVAEVAGSAVAARAGHGAPA